MGAKHSRIKRQVRTTGIDPKEAASCYGKIRHTREDAYERASKLSTMKAYACRFCHFFHVGHKPARA